MRYTLNRVRLGVEAVLITALFAIVALTFCDVLGRRLFGTPVYGAHDLTEHLMVVIIFCGLPLVTADRGHLAVDLFDRWLSSPRLRWWHALVSVGVAAILFLIAWQYLLAAQQAVLIHEASQALYIPRSYMYVFMAFTAFLAGLAALLPASIFKGPGAQDQGGTPL
ncbi:MULTISPECIES: TRAP transporter small permease [Halomonadaceae]|uniref:TRAP transporter small permease n=1 Tax=Halomonadaceae TaxID=28256 RepID=UPI00159A2CFF|nr:MULTISPECIES: TRAP transporter small permease [Halomonas]QJQ94844.1 TRAP transporter small permease [Halomonas sp. PA5]